MYYLKHENGLYWRGEHLGGIVTTKLYHSLESAVEGQLYALMQYGIDLEIEVIE